MAGDSLRAMATRDDAMADGEAKGLYSAPKGQAALDMAEGLLEGRTLLPHFRVTGKGIDLRRFFDEPRTFDLVPMITGPGIVPYLAEGKVLTAAEFEAVRSRFGSTGMMPFAIWFN